MLELPLLVRLWLFFFLPQGLFGYDSSIPFPHTNSPFPLVSNGENGVFTAETVTQWNCPIFAKRALNVRAQAVSFCCGFAPNPRETEFWAS